MSFNIPGGRYSGTSTEFIKAYIDNKVSGVVSQSPETLNTLKELAEAIGSDPAFFTTMATANNNLQNQINAVHADSDAAELALSNRLNTLEADPTTATAVAAVQADVDANEAAALAARTALQTLLQNAIDAVQADVDTNESDADAAVAAVQADVDANEADRKTYFKWDSNLTKVVNPLRSSEIEIGNNIHIDPAAGYATQFDGNVEFDNNTVLSHGGTDLTATFAEINGFDGRLDTLEADPTTAAAVAAVQADVDQNESDADAAIAAVQADVDQNEADADAAIALRAPIASPAFTGQHITHTAGDTQPTTHKIIGGFPDFILQTNQGDFATHQNEGRLLFNDAGAGSHGAIKMKLHSTGTMDFFVGGITAGDKVMSIASDSVDVESLKIGGTAVTSTADELNYCDGVTSNIQTQLDAIQADVDTNESDADTAIALKFDKAGGSITGNFDVVKSFPDITLKAGDERRVLFSDAGGSAEGGFKFASNTLKVFAGGAIAGANEVAAFNGTTAEFKHDVVQNPSASVTPAENGELMVEATNNTTLTFKLKGSDGTVRSGTITLS